MKSYITLGSCMKQFSGDEAYYFDNVPKLE